jgi:hypothetical protein
MCWWRRRSPCCPHRRELAAACRLLHAGCRKPCLEPAACWRAGMKHQVARVCLCPCSLTALDFAGQCAVGFSGVLFGLMLIDARTNPNISRFAGSCWRKASRTLTALLTSFHITWSGPFSSSSAMRAVVQEPVWADHAACTGLPAYPAGCLATPSSPGTAAAWQGSVQPHSHA